FGGSVSRAQTGGNSPGLRSVRKPDPPCAGARSTKARWALDNDGRARGCVDGAGGSQLLSVLLSRPRVSAARKGGRVRHRSGTAIFAVARPHRSWPLSLG